MCTSSTDATYAVAAETGPDTGVFTMEVALEGYALTTGPLIPQVKVTNVTDSSCTSSELQT